MRPASVIVNRATPRRRAGMGAALDESVLYEEVQVLPDVLGWPPSAEATSLSVTGCGPN